MRSHWKSVVMVAALALFMGIAAPAWSQPTDPAPLPPPQPSLVDPMAEEYSVHVIPFYKIDANWFAFLVVADTSFQDLDERSAPGGAPGGTPIFMTFYTRTCALVADVVIRPTTADAQLLALHDEHEADGQFLAIPTEGVILLDGRSSRFLTYVLLVNANNNSIVRIDSIPCAGPVDSAGNRRPCTRNETSSTGTWLRYDTYNTIAATMGHHDDTAFHTWLYFFSSAGDLRTELLRYGRPRHGQWAIGIHVDAWCDEIYLGSRRRDLLCTERVPLSDFNFTRLNVFPDNNCAGKPGHIETWASNNGVDLVDADYSGFQETIAELVHGINLIGTGYMHHSEDNPSRRPLENGD